MDVTSEPMQLPLRDPEFWQDPYPFFTEARRRHRTARTHSGELVTLSAADAEAASSHSSLVPLGVDALDRLGMTPGPFRQWRALSLNAQIGDDHTRLRSLVGRAFSPRQVERVRSLLRSFIDELLATTADRVVDVHSEIGHEIPLFSICAFLGIPVEDRARIDEFMVGTEEGFSFPMTPEKQARADAGIVALYEYSAELIERRRSSPGDDLVSALVAAEIEGDRLSHDELLAMIVNLIGGAVGSSDAGIANMVHLMATGVADMASVGADPASIGADPALVGAFVEEVLRFRPPFRSTRRKALAEVEIAGERLAPGATVLISRQAANRDPDRFHDPDRFDIHRTHERHLSFGYGPHYCLGQALARLNLTETAAALLSMWQRVELVDDDIRRVPFDPTERFESLRVRPTVRSEKAEQR